jgi:hypothetical protein
MVKECDYMTQDISSIVITSLFIGICVLMTVSIFIRLLKNRYAPIKTVEATVIDKHKIETFSKYSATGQNEKYVIVFSVDGKKKSFYVSPFSYDGYRVDEKGMLKYKGDRIIGFE